MGGARYAQGVLDLTVDGEGYPDPVGPVQVLAQVECVPLRSDPIEVREQPLGVGDGVTRPCREPVGVDDVSHLRFRQVREDGLAAGVVVHVRPRSQDGVDVDTVVATPAAHVDHLPVPVGKQPHHHPDILPEPCHRGGPRPDDLELAPNGLAVLEEPKCEFVPAGALDHASPLPERRQVAVNGARCESECLGEFGDTRAVGSPKVFDDVESRFVGIE